MNTIINLFSVLVPWSAAAIVPPLLLWIVRAAINIISNQSNKRQSYRDKKYFASYTQRGYY